MKGIEVEYAIGAEAGVLTELPTWAKEGFAEHVRKTVSELVEFGEKKAAVRYVEQANSYDVKIWEAAVLFTLNRIWEASGAELNIDTHERDARKWEAAFNKNFPALAAPEGLMLSWFACAIMAGYDHGRTSLGKSIDEGVLSEAYAAFEVLDNERKGSFRKKTFKHVIRSYWGRLLSI